MRLSRGPSAGRFGRLAQTPSSRELGPLLRHVPCRERRRIGCGLRDLTQPVAISVMKRLLLAGNDQQSVLLIRPGAIRVDVDLDRVAICAERLLEKWIGYDAVGKRAAYGREREGLCVSSCPADRHSGLPSGDRQSQQYRLSRGLPQPVTDLIVKGFRVLRLHYSGVVAQTIKELWPIGLGIDRLEFVPLYEGLMLGTCRLWIDIHAVGTGPDAGHSGQWTEIGQCVRIRFGFRIDVGRIVIHGGSEPRDFAGERWRSSFER